MDKLLDNMVIEPGYNKNDGEQDQRSSRGSALEVALKSVVNKADHGVESANIVGRTHIFAKDTDDAGVFLETADKAGDNNVSQHGGEQGNGDPHGRCRCSP